MGSESIDRDDLLDIVRRGPMLATLREGPLDRREVEERLDISKSTSHRNLTSLVDRGMVRKSDGRYELTGYGRAVAQEASTFEASIETAAALAPVYDAVSGIEPPCPIDAFDDAVVTSTVGGDPFAPLARFVSLVEATGSLCMADSYAIAPTYIDEIHGRVLDGLETRVVERPEVAEDVMENYPRKCVELCASEFLAMRILEDIPFGLTILDDRVGIGIRDAETGAPRTFVDSGASEARDWAERVFESAWNRATPLERFNPRALSEAMDADAG